MPTEKEKCAYLAIKKFAVFTADNIECTLLKHLKSSNYVCIPVDCRWSGIHKESYMVLNIDLNACKFYCGKCQQTPFIYSEVNDDGGIFSYYYAKADIMQPYHPERNDYVVKDTCDECMEYICRVEDGYIIIGHSFEYSVFFSVFEDVDQIINNNITRILMKEKKENTPQNRDNIIEFASRRAGLSPYLCRKALYKGLL